MSFVFTLFVVTCEFVAMKHKEGGMLWVLLTVVGVMTLALATQNAAEDLTNALHRVQTLG